LLFKIIIIELGKESHDFLINLRGGTIGGMSYESKEFNEREDKRAEQV